MNVIETGNKKVIIEISDLELLAINNSLNEVCHGLRIGDFSPRIGVEKKFVEIFARQINKLLHEIGPIE